MIKWKTSYNDVIKMAGGKTGELILLLCKRFQEEDISVIKNQIKHTINVQLYDMKKKKYPEEVIKYFSDEYYSLPGIARKKKLNKKKILCKKHMETRKNE